MRKVLTLVLVLFCINCIGQDEWLGLGKSNNGNEVFMKNAYVSRGVYHTHLDVIKIWVKFIVPKETINGTTYTNVTDMYLFGIDVETKEVGIISIYSYSSTNKLLKSTSIKDYQVKFSVPAPSTMGEKIVNSTLDLFKDN
jgi:hypothetical protein